MLNPHLILIVLFPFFPAVIKLVSAISQTPAAGPDLNQLQQHQFDLFTRTDIQKGFPNFIEQATHRI